MRPAASIRRVAAALLASAVASAAALAAGTAAAATLKATLLLPQDDPRLERSRLERGYLGHPGGPAGDGLQVALDEGRFELDALGAEIALSTTEVRGVDGARAAAQAAEKGGAAVLLADLPVAALLAVADAVKIPVLNLGVRADRLREQDCRARLWHLMPSERMRSDALAQLLVSRKWSKVLLLVGPGADDQARSASAQASLKRYGLQVVGSKPFKLSADPRERDLANPLLLTAGSGYDIVWVVDSDGEFARSLPYRSVLPRPVVGDGGLVALGWHERFERFGAPQEARRFAKAAKRPMTESDWTAWLAGKLLIAVAASAPKGPNAAWADAIAKTPVDGSKGTMLSFRPWDGQLRQPMLLTDGEGVIATAPVEGLLHPRDVLDTLGADGPEKLCKVRQ